MTSNDSEIKALHLNMARVLDDTEYFLHDLRGQKEVKDLVEQDVRELRDHLSRLDEHLEHLQWL